jgi:hypothetical protein
MTTATMKAVIYGEDGRFKLDDIRNDGYVLLSRIEELFILLMAIAATPGAPNHPSWWRDYATKRYDWSEEAEEPASSTGDPDLTTGSPWFRI